MSENQFLVENGQKACCSHTLSGTKPWGFLFWHNNVIVIYYNLSLEIFWWKFRFHMIVKHIFIYWCFIFLSVLASLMQARVLHPSCVALCLGVAGFANCVQVSDNTCMLLVVRQPVANCCSMPSGMGRGLLLRVKCRNWVSHYQFPLIPLLGKWHYIGQKIVF